MSFSIYKKQEKKNEVFMKFLLFRSYRLVLVLCRRPIKKNIVKKDV
jgi:hypothetical protein